jgi:glycosyltransferase involved in cell wall biosynthesis
VILPNDIDDPARPSGGNVYDRRLCNGLAALGWTVCEHAVPGAWPAPSPDERAGLGRLLAALPDGARVLVDGLVGLAVPDLLQAESDRLSLVLLVHMPLRDGAARAALEAATAVVTTSSFARDWLAEHYDLPAARLHVATPGVDPAPAADGSDDGTRLLCVAVVRPHKGHDLLVEALAAIADLPFTCDVVGGLDHEPDFVAVVRRRVADAGLTERVRLVGPRTGAELGAAYAAADLLVLPSRGETYGMVVTEALARGIPVVTTAATGLPEALGRAPDGGLPGLLVPPEDAAALTGALRDWLSDAGLRGRLRAAARERRAALTGWETTAATVSRVLTEVA